MLGYKGSDSHRRKSTPGYTPPDLPWCISRSGLAISIFPNIHPQNQIPTMAKI